MGTKICLGGLSQSIRTLCSDQSSHLPLARLKLRPVNRLSCVVEYSSTNTEASKQQLRSRAGLALSGKQIILLQNNDP